MKLKVRNKVEELWVGCGNDGMTVVQVQVEGEVVKDDVSDGKGVDLG